MGALGIAILIAVLGLNAHDIRNPEDPPMTVQARQKFNGGMFDDACVFDLETGSPTVEQCADYRGVNHESNQGRPGLSLMRKGGYYYKPTVIPEGLWQATLDKVPEGITLHVHDTVGEVEVVCYTEQFLAGKELPRYVPGCHNPSTNTIHVAAGDVPTLEHEIRHSHEGPFHDEQGREH